MAEPEWSDFKVLLALGRGGSVAGAARILGVDHSTVSRRLAALEESIEARLLLRGGREFTWTAEGRTLLAAAEAVEAAISEATRSVRSAKLGIEGTVRLSCAPGLSAALSRLLLTSRKKHPQLAIEICAENRTVDLARGEADIALRMFRPSEPDLVCRRACEMAWGVYASKSYIAEHGAPATAADLAQHNLVLYSEALHGAPGPRWLEDHRGNAPVAGRVDNTQVAVQVIASGAGVGVIPCFLALSHAELVRVIQEPVGHATGFIVYHEATRDTARVRAAVDALVELFDEHAHVFSGGTD